MYYMVGSAGTIISDKLPQYNINQVTTGGSTENAKRIIKGELDMGIVYGATTPRPAPRSAASASSSAASCCRDSV
jgi:TRAP-type uncharacterized transport system substrate-binding protein